MTRRRSCCSALGIAGIAGIGGVLFCLAPELRATSTVVGTGTPASCSPFNLQEGLDTLRDGGGTLTFACGPLPHTIVVTGMQFGHDEVNNSRPIVDGGGLITISGGGLTKIFSVPPSRKLELRNLTLTRGVGSMGPCVHMQGILGNPRGELRLQNVTIFDCESTAWSGAISVHTADAEIVDSRIFGNRAASGGGGIGVFDGSLTLERSDVSGNETGGEGGGGLDIWSATLAMSDSRVAGNRVLSGGTAWGGGILARNVTGTIEGSWLLDNRAAAGGGLYLWDASDLEVRRSRIAGNVAASEGGGAIFVEPEADLVLAFSTLDRNEAATTGGAVHGDGALSLRTSTLSENVAGVAGGAVRARRAATLLDLTIAGNRAPTASALHHGDVDVITQPLTLHGVLFADLAAATGQPCLFEDTLQAITHSLWPGTSCGSSTADGNLPQTALPLVPLGWSCAGGAAEVTPTHAPFAGSLAEDAGVCDALLPTDQRGVARPQGAGCDIGAYEAAAPSCGALFRDGFDTGTTFGWSFQPP